MSTRDLRADTCNSHCAEFFLQAWMLLPWSMEVGGTRTAFFKSGILGFLCPANVGSQGIT